jgi:very-short-patch-repair endonuclease
MSRPSTPLPEWSAEPFRAKDARARGIGEKRLRGGDLLAPFSGVRVPATEQDPDPVLARCAAYAATMAPGQFFSHSTAARIHGLPVPGREEGEPLHVTVFQPDRAPRARGILGHHARAESFDVVVRHGWFVVAPADTLRQLATSLRVEDVVVAGDSAVGGRDPLVSMGELQALARRQRGARGAAVLRAAVDLIRVGAESPQETRLRLLLRNAGLPEPELNLDIQDAAGRFVARGDLVYPQYRVVVEYDGDQHRTSRAQFERDVERLEELSRTGWRVIRVLAHHLRDAPALAARVRAALRAGGWQG